MHTYINFSVRISVQSLWKDVDHLVEAVDGRGDEAVGKRVAVVGAENALLLSRIVAEAPEEEMMKGFELVNLLNLLALGRAHQLKWQQQVIVVTCISDNAKSTEHVTGLFINSSKSVKKTKLCSCKEARQFWSSFVIDIGPALQTNKQTNKNKVEISNLHWNPRLPVSSLHRISHSESSLLENLILTNIWFFQRRQCHCFQIKNPLTQPFPFLLAARRCPLWRTLCSHRTERGLVGGKVMNCFNCFNVLHCLSYSLTPGLDLDPEVVQCKCSSTYLSVWLKCSSLCLWCSAIASFSVVQMYYNVVQCISM